MLTIGQMSKVCGANVKTLRHYDKTGPLKSQRADEINGYRYHEDPQAGTTLSVRGLKRYGFSLMEIQALLTIPNSRELLQQPYKQRLHLGRQVGHISVTIGETGCHLGEFKRTGDTMSYRNNYKIQIKEAEGQVPVTRRNKMSVKEFGTYYEKIHEKTIREHMTINGVITATYHDQELDSAYSDIELGVGITERDKTDFVMLGCLCTTTTHEGAYSGLPDAYGAIVAWINANEYHVSGMPYEIYRKTQLDKLPPEE